MVVLRTLFSAGLLLFLTHCLSFADQVHRFMLDIESGVAIVGYSDIQIPKSTGTLISFSEDLETDPAFFIRGRFTYYFNKGNVLSILIAPLRLRHRCRKFRALVKRLMFIRTFNKLRGDSSTERRNLVQRSWSSSSGSPLML